MARVEQGANLPVQNSRVLWMVDDRTDENPHRFHFTAESGGERETLGEFRAAIGSKQFDALGH
jgi:hypothetical protein